MSSVLASADAQAQLSKQLGISVEKVQELEFAASVSGSSAEALDASLLGLAEKIGEAAAQGEANFERLGINVKKADGSIKNTSEVMEDLRDKFQDLSDVERINYAQKLGIDKSLVQLLSKSSSEMDALRKQAQALGVVTDEEAGRIMAYNDSLTVLSYGFDAIKKDIALGFAPQLKELADAFTNLLVENKQLITEGISKTIQILAAGVKAVFNFGTVIYKLIDNTIGWKVAIAALTTAVLYFNKALLLNPITWVAIAIAALIVVVDDLVVAFKGGKSFIADFFKNTFDIDIVESINKGLDWMRNILIKISEIASSVFNKITNVIDKGKEIAGSLGDLPGDVFDAGTKLGENIADSINQGLDFAGSIFSPNDAVPAMANNTTNSNLKIDKIEINTTDPQQAGIEVEKKLKSMMGEAKNQARRGGR
jgi:hypothetical protein